MTTYTLTVSTSALGLGIIDGARVSVDRKRTQVTDIYNSQSLGRNSTATNSSGVATILLEPDDGSVYHELKIFDLAGILVYSRIFTMPPQAIALTDLPVQDIITNSAVTAVAAAETATEQAVIATDKAVSTAADRVQTGLDVIATGENVVLTANDVATTAEAVVDAVNAKVASEAASLTSQAASLTSQAARDAVIGYRNVYATTAKALSKGVLGVTSIVAGSGGTNGTFALAFSGGAGSGAAGTFTVVGGAVTNISITANGDSYTSAPTLSFSASTGLTGASAVSIIANNVDVNEYFSVPSSLASESFIFYKNNAGTAQELFRLPSSYNLKVQGMDTTTHFAVVDSIGNKLIDVTPTNILHPVIQSLVETQTAANATIAAVKPSMGAAELDIIDAAKNRLIKITPTKILHPTITDLSNRLDTATSGVNVVKRLGNSSQSSAYALLASISHFLLYGQSLSLGSASGGGINTTAMGAYAVMPNGGIYWRENTTDPAVGFSSLMDMLETERETGMYAAIKMLVQLLNDEDGIDFSTVGQTILGTSAGVGSTDITQLLTTHYYRVTEDFVNGKILADNLNKSYSPAALFYIQGESDYSHSTTRAAYLASLRTMQTQVQASAQSAAGTTKSLPMMTYQTSCHFSGAYARATPDIALAQLKASLNEDNANSLITMVTPTYFLTYSNDHVHMIGTSYDWMLAYFGLAVKRWFFDGVKPKPLAPKEACAFGKTIILRFDLEAGKKLVIDTVTVAAQTNYGFQVVDSGGTALTISTVTVLQDRVEIRLSATVPTGAVVRYGWISTTGGTLGLGNIRDNTGDTLKYDPYGANNPLHKWLPIFEKETTT